MRRVLVSVAMVLGLAGPWLLAARCREREVHTLPPAERAAFVQRTLANLEALAPRFAWTSTPTDRTPTRSCSA